MSSSQESRVWKMWATCNSRREIAKYERGEVRSTGFSLSGSGALKRLFAVAQRPTATTNLIPLEQHALTVFVLLRRFFHTLQESTGPRAVSEHRAPHRTARPKRRLRATHHAPTVGSGLVPPAPRLSLSALHLRRRHPRQEPHRSLCAFDGCLCRAPRTLVHHPELLAGPQAASIVRAPRATVPA